MKSDNEMSYNTLIFEEYKLFVSLMDKTSERRNQSNQFYTTLLSGMLVILTLAFEKNAFIELNQSLIFFLVGILGVFLCIVWKLNIRSYRQLNTGKFKVIHEIEQKLPYPLYKREWELLGKGNESNKYFQLSRVEGIVPLIIMIPYIALVIISIYYSLT